MPARFLQPYPSHGCDRPVPEQDRVVSPVPVYFIRFRYPHHAAASGYDRLCDYTGETIQLSRPLYWLGETLLRPWALYQARRCGHYEYSRYDCIMETAAIRHFLAHRRSVYHFIYGEKSFRRLARHAGQNDNRIVCTVHHPASHHAWLFKRGMEHFRKVDLVTVVSRNMVEPWESIVGKGRVKWVPYAVDAHYFTPPAGPRPPRPPRCLFIGHHERDFESLPALVQGILSSHPAVEFMMVSRDQRCEAVAQKNPRARWIPRVSDEEYLNLLCTSDLLVLPLKKSTTNTAVLEALACGLPIITNVGGIEDYLSPECSRVFPVGEGDAMAAAVVSLLENEGERLRMAQAARQRALAFSWSSIARQMAGLYPRLWS